MELPIIPKHDLIIEKKVKNNSGMINLRFFYAI